MSSCTTIPSASTPNMLNCASTMHTETFITIARQQLQQCSDYRQDPKEKKDDLTLTDAAGDR